MKTRKKLPVALVGLVVLALLPRPAAAGDPAAGLQQWLDGTRDLRARFEQELVSGALGAGEVESGRLMLAKPGRMRWDYERPERKVALVDGDRTVLWVEADRQLWRGRLEESERLLPSLLAAERPIAELFEVSALDPDREGRPRVRLVPQGAAESVTEVLLSLRAEDHSIVAANVLDAAGNRVRYRFTRLRRNRGLPEDAFEFEPPPGTDIIENP